MNIYFFIAGVLTILLGLAHSIIGEILIFHSKRNKGEIVPTKTSVDWKERYLRIVWVTWHLASLLGWCLAGILFCLAFAKEGPVYTIIQCIITSLCLSSLLVLYGTKGRHPAWLVLLIISFILWMGM